MAYLFITWLVIFEYVNKYIQRKVILNSFYHILKIINQIKIVLIKHKTSTTQNGDIPGGIATST